MKSFVLSLFFVGFCAATKNKALTKVETEILRTKIVENGSKNDVKNAVSKLAMRSSQEEPSMAMDGMESLQKKIKKIGNSLLKSQDDNVERDSGVKETMEGDWKVKNRERAEKQHQDGIKSFKAGAAEVKDKGDETTDEKAHEARKMSISVRGSDPKMEKNGNFFRSVEKKQMVQKTWSSNDEETGTLMSDSTMRNAFPGFPSFSQNFAFNRRLDDPERSMIASPMIDSLIGSSQRLDTRRQDAEGEPLLKDLVAKLMDSLKDDEEKEKFRREMDEAEKEALADDNSVGSLLMRNNLQAPVDEKREREMAEVESPQFVFRRRPTFFIH